MGVQLETTIYNMKVALVLYVLSAMIATVLSTRVVDVDLTSLEKQTDLPQSGRFLENFDFPVCCSFVRKQCERDCAGIACSSSCNARCGLFRVCAAMTCSEVASSTCTS